MHANIISFLEESRASGRLYRHGKLPDAGAQLFSLTRLESLLSNPLLTPNWVRLSVNNGPRPLEHMEHWKLVQRKELRFLEKTSLLEALQAGGALVLEGLDILDPTINEICSAIDESLPCALSNCEAFFSQRGNEAYQGHCDSDDVLAIQISGRKDWNLYSQQQRRYVGNAELTEDQMGPVIETIQMRAGDILFVRAGVPHRCATVEGHSLHLSFDLCDRSPNAEQFTSVANRLYNARLPACHSGVPLALQTYVEIIESPDFSEAMIEECLRIRSQVLEFRKRIAAAHLTVPLRDIN